MVRRLALKTRFREIGWGSTPLSSANIQQKGRPVLNTGGGLYHAKWNKRKLQNIQLSTL